MKTLKLCVCLACASLLVWTNGCKEDAPDPVAIASIIATGTDLQTGVTVDKDLNAATSAEDVPLDAVIKITFVRELDVATVNNSNITLSQDGNTVDISVSASGAVVTLTPASDLDRGLIHTLDIEDGIMAMDGGEFSATSRTFKSAGRADAVPPQEASQLAYWKMDGNANSTNGTYNGTETGITYVVDRFGNQESAAGFDGDVSLIEVPYGDQLITQSWTLSLWMYVDSTDHKNVNGNGKAGHFVMGVGDLYGFFIEVQGSLDGMKLTARYEKEDMTTLPNDFFFNGDGKDKNNGGWEGIDFEKDLTATGGLGAKLDQRWAHLVMVYDAATRTRHLYIDGELMETDNFNNTTGLNTVTGLTFDASGAGSDVIGTALAFGFNHDMTTTHWSDTDWGDYAKAGANHFKGALDDIRIFEAALDLSEVMALYNAEK